MNEDNMLCSSCGAAIKEGDHFCSKCGLVVSVTPDTAVPPPLPTLTPPGIVPGNVAPPPVPGSLIPPLPPATNSNPSIPQPPAGQERVISVVSKITLKTGVFSSELYHLAVTDQRLIFARQTKEMQAADAQHAREQAKQQGKNLFGKIGAQISAGSGEKYLGMAPEVIMNEDPQNFAVPLAEVTKINTYHGDFEDNSPDTMELITITGKWKFQINNYYKVQQQLKEVLGSKVH